VSNKSSFDELLDDMYDVPVARQLGYYVLPIILALFCTASFFNVFNKLLKFLHVSSFDSKGPRATFRVFSLVSSRLVSSRLVSFEFSAFVFKFRFGIV